MPPIVRQATPRAPGRPHRWDAGHATRASGAATAGRTTTPSVRPDRRGPCRAGPCSVRSVVARCCGGRPVRPPCGPNSRAGRARCAASRPAPGSRRSVRGAHGRGPSRPPRGRGPTGAGRSPWRISGLRVALARASARAAWTSAAGHSRGPAGALTPQVQPGCGVSSRSAGSRTRTTSPSMSTSGEPNAVASAEAVTGSGAGRVGRLGPRVDHRPALAPASAQQRRDRPPGWPPAAAVRGPRSGRRPSRSGVRR